MLDIEDLGSWKGVSTGRYHIDSLGVKTNPAFWKGIKATRPGKVSISPPLPGSMYFEYAALVMAATAVEARSSFQVLEIGAAWGVWSARAAAIAGRLGIPVRTIAIEALPVRRQHIDKHYLTNGLNPACHEIVETIVAQEKGEAWFRFANEADLGARICTTDWVSAHAIVPPMAAPRSTPIPCKDGSSVLKMRSRPIAGIVKPGTILDLVHLRIGPNPARMLDADVFAAKNVGVFVIPNINDADISSVDERMKSLGYKQVLALAGGTLVPTSRDPVKIDQALRIFAGEKIGASAIEEMAQRLTKILAGPGR